MALGDDRDLRNFLKAVVALALGTGLPCDGANDPRDIVEAEWFDAAQMTEDLVASGHLIVVPDQPNPHYVAPTPLGIFEAIS